MKSGSKAAALLLVLLLAAQALTALPEAGAESIGPAGFSAAEAGRETGADRRMLIMPASLTEVGEDAFAGTAAEHILLSDTTETLGDRAFEGMGALVSVYLPDSLTAIGRSVFGGAADALVLGNHGSFAQAWAKASGMDYSGARVRRTTLETRRAGDWMTAPTAESAPGAENESDDTVSPTPRMRAEGIRAYLPMGRGDRAEMNHLVGLFP